MRPVGTQTPRMYGLPKVHKPGVPLRPILDMRNSPYHSVARWLCEILEPVRKIACRYTIRDTFDFVSKIKELNINSKLMFSLDISSLFTNVPLIETVDYICDLIQQHNIPIGLPLAKLKELILRCTLNVQFQFNGTFYRQIDGVAMGSPLGPILADLFMSKLENTTLSEDISNFMFYGRYVDDIFVICDSSADHVLTAERFNNAHPNISFTHELECNNQMPFLDVLLTRTENGSIKRNVYHKPTWTGQYTHFNSFVPLKIKRNLVQSLCARTRNICSDDVLEEELNALRNTLRANGYPDRFLDKHMQHRVTEPKPTVPRKPLYLRLGFKGDKVSEAILNKLKKAVTQTYFAADVRLSFSSRPLFRQNLKDKVPQVATSMCIYQFACSCGDGYIGRTTRMLSKRMSEHIPAAYIKGRTCTSHSSILTHLMDTGHHVNVHDAFKPIYHISFNAPKAVKSRILSIAEAIAIRIHRPKLCIQKNHVRTLSLSWPRDCLQVNSDRLIPS